MSESSLYIITKQNIDRSADYQEEGNAIGLIRIPPETKEYASLSYGLDLLFNDSPSSLHNVSKNVDAENNDAPHLGFCHIEPNQRNVSEVDNITDTQNDDVCDAYLETFL